MQRNIVLNVYDQICICYIINLIFLFYNTKIPRISLDDTKILGKSQFIDHSIISINKKVINLYLSVIQTSKFKHT